MQLPAGHCSWMPALDLKSTLPRPGLSDAYYRYVLEHCVVRLVSNELVRSTRAACTHARTPHDSAARALNTSSADSVVDV